MNKIAIIGAGGFGREVQMLIHQINFGKPTFEFIGYFDDHVPEDTILNGSKVIGKIENISEYAGLSIVIAIGDPLVKKDIIVKLSLFNVSYPTLIHPNVIIGDNVTLGVGCIICAGGIITENINIGNFVILNLQCTVGHDSTIDSYCSVMPGVNISGDVKLEESVYIGTGAKIINKITIGNNTIIGAGAVVAKNVPANSTAVGVPAKVIKYND